MPSMGFQFGLDKEKTTYKRKFRWLFKIPEISAEGTDALPPSKAARPSVSFKEIEVQHINEIIYFPGKPEWKTFNLTLYDIKCKKSPVMDWIKRLYDPEEGLYKFIINGESDNLNIKLDANLELYDGCGNCLEVWFFENCWPQSVDFQDLDMSANEVLMADITLRYDRAYILEC